MLEFENQSAGAILRQVADLLPRFAYRVSNERAFQEGLEEVLLQAGIPYQREHVASEKDRFDFLVADNIVIEAKVRGSYSAALHQIRRYAARPDVAGVLLVTTRFWGSVSGGADQMMGKPMMIIQVRGAAF